MKIDSGHNGYYYQGRSSDTDRKPEEAPQREAATTSRFPNALTGSSTLLSQSLANALWVMGSGDATDAQTGSISQDWVMDRYQEFA
jgi:hypothetical protein